MLDGDDSDPVMLVVDVVDHPIIAPSGAVEAPEFKFERLADSMGAGRE
jgi:hypothetical protein